MKQLQKAKFYQTQGELVHCQLCHHFCVVKNQSTGLCGARKNINGQLYSLVYGRPAAINIDPIEKKPLFHFLPGSTALSLGTYGCNFRCLNCLNYDLSQPSDLEKQTANLEYLAPAEIIKLAKKTNVASIAYTYNEPTIFVEYTLDIMKLAKEQGLKNIWISNGYWSDECFKNIAPFLDAVNVDLKSFDNDFYLKNCQAQVEPVLENLKKIKLAGIHLEITTLIIPGLSDDLKKLGLMADFIKNELGLDTPWHLSKFSPEISWRLKDLPATDLKTLGQIYQMAKEKGLNYIYLGNVADQNKENTYCPKCGELIIKRIYYQITKKDKNGACPKCGEKILSS
ncbi:MAG TPA: AmmeMemoRadiSam system radical SAM enzyme [bacterium]|nr:AmmeMemoRadiSam system radical SAM enzyme [bacterium]HPL95727.1 AmmeMemoRadiSam system radical SAM enzyme [bacterium]